MNGTISLQGSPEQVRELHKALVGMKCVLMSIGGTDQPMDMLIEQRLQKISYWIEEAEKGLGV